MDSKMFQAEAEEMGFTGPDASEGISIAILINNKPGKEFDSDCNIVLDQLKIMYDKAEMYTRCTAAQICTSLSQLISLSPIRILHVIVVGYSQNNAPIDYANNAIGLREALKPFTPKTQVLLTLFGSPRPQDLGVNDAVEVGGPNTVTQFHQAEYSAVIRNSQNLRRHLSQHFLHRLHELIHVFCVTIPAWLYSDNSESALMVFVLSLQKSRGKGLFSPGALQEAANNLADEYQLNKALEPVVKNGPVPCWI